MTKDEYIKLCLLYDVNREYEEICSVSFEEAKSLYKLKNREKLDVDDLLSLTDILDKMMLGEKGGISDV